MRLRSRALYIFAAMDVRFIPQFLANLRSPFFREVKDVSLHPSVYRILIIIYEYKSDFKLCDSRKALVKHNLETNHSFNFKDSFVIVRIHYNQHWKIVEFYIIQLNKDKVFLINPLLVHSAEAVEYTDCISAEGYDSPNECPGYDIKQSDGEAPVIPPLPGSL